MDKLNTTTVNKFMKALIDFEAHSVMSDFNRIFGADYGEDLWSEFLNQCNSNTTMFYRILDEKQQKVFEQYLSNTAEHMVS
ncbi:hypothetical protein [Microscilla marina]|uniref:Uncharacterized protein n=1 Tax=Microscilla marina ATCC 23134 TaxID=313606 RepID=A1ZHU2_MICM2|nr:hypothetical protein [Microscilla marina]EAY30099.1 hypothetical protein M23134_05432 [Microscilla marina ATCC 23134]